MRGFKELLSGKVPAKVLAEGRFGFDIVGDVAIVEIARGQARHERAIARALRALYPHVRAVAKKTGGHEGRYRIQKLKVIAGAKDLRTEHREAGVRLRVDVGCVYFSPRLAEERLRIARAVKPGERVLVMFSGVGSYPLVIAKHSQAKEAVGVEWNPAAHKAALENIILNKLAGRVKAYRGDARKVVPRLGRFDRIVMPLPETAITFLDVALRAARKNATIHLYAFAREDGIGALKKDILAACAKADARCRITAVQKAGQHAPRVYRFRADIQVASPSRRK